MQPCIASELCQAAVGHPHETDEGEDTCVARADKRTLQALFFTTYVPCHYSARAMAGVGARGAMPSGCAVCAARLHALVLWVLRTEVSRKVMFDKYYIVR